MQEQVACRNCGTSFTRSRMGRPALFCKDKCRALFHQRKRLELERHPGAEWIDHDFLWERDGHKCWICNEPIDIAAGGARRMSVDHVTPMARGGTHTYDNVAAAHMACNVGRWRSTQGR